MTNKIIGDFYRLELGEQTYLMLDRRNKTIQICHPEEIPIAMVKIGYVRENLVERLVSLIEDEVNYDDHCRDMQTYEEE